MYDVMEELAELIRRHPWLVPVLFVVVVLGLVYVAWF